MLPDLSKYERVDVHLQYRLRDDVGPRKSEQEMLALAIAGNPELMKFMSSMWSAPQSPSEPSTPPVSDGLPEVVDMSVPTSGEGIPERPTLPDHVTVWHGRPARIVSPTIIILPPAPPGGWRGVDYVGLELAHPMERHGSMFGSMTEIAGLSGETLERAASVMPAAGPPRPYRLGQRLDEGDVLVLDLGLKATARRSAR